MTASSIRRRSAQESALPGVLLGGAGSAAMALRTQLFGSAADTQNYIDGNGTRCSHLRKAHLARLLARRPEGIFVSDFQQGEIGPDLFRWACKFGSEDWVRKEGI